LRGGALHVFVDCDEFDDFEGFSAGRGRDLDFIADLAVEKSLANRRGCGDEAFFGVNFFAADELVLDLDVFVGIENENSGAVTGTIFGNVGEIQHSEVAHAFFQLADAGVDETLALLCVFVFGVFGEVTVRACDGNFLGEFDVELVVEPINFFLELLLNFRDGVKHCNPPKKSCAGRMVLVDEPPPRRETL